ncbi:MAG: hypothetical protein FJZ62_04820 [Chlamydiae bacterium]|nr:hypothetical protein [Chlamydiota bacterium]
MFHQISRLEKNERIWKWIFIAFCAFMILLNIAFFVNFLPTKKILKIDDYATLFLNLALYFFLLRNAGLKNGIILLTIVLGNIALFLIGQTLLYLGVSFGFLFSNLASSFNPSSNFFHEGMAYGFYALVFFLCLKVRKINQAFSNN